MIKSKGIRKKNKRKGNKRKKRKKNYFKRQRTSNFLHFKAYFTARNQRQFFK